MSTNKEEFQAQIEREINIAINLADEYHAKKLLAQQTFEYWQIQVKALHTINARLSAQIAEEKQNANKE